MDSISTKSFKKCPMRTLVCPIRALVPVHNNPDMNQRWSKVVITSMYFLMISLKMHFKNTGKSQVWIFEHMQLPNVQSFIGEYTFFCGNTKDGAFRYWRVLFKFEWYSSHAGGVQIVEVLCNSVFGKMLIEFYKFGSSAVVKKLNFRSYLKIFVSWMRL